MRIVQYDLAFQLQRIDEQLTSKLLAAETYRTLRHFERRAVFNFVNDPLLKNLTLIGFTC